MVESGPAPAGRLVAVANLKGGTGKSTIAVNLACLAAREDRPVLLVDADPQGTAAAWLEPDARPAGLAVEALPLVGDAGAWADRLFAASRTHARIVIDMPPQSGPGMEAALGLIDALVIPVTPSAIDLRATAKTLRQLRLAQRRRAGRPAALLVPNRVDQRTAVGRAIQQALRDLGLEVAPPIAQRASQATAFQAGQWIGAHAPGSPARREMAAVAAKLDAALAAAPANDFVPSGTFCLAEEMLVWEDDLLLTDARPPLTAIPTDRPPPERTASTGNALVSPLGGTGLVLDDLLAPPHRTDIAPPLDRASYRPVPTTEHHDDVARAPDDAADSSADRPFGWLWNLLASMRQLTRPHTG